MRRGFLNNPKKKKANSVPSREDDVKKRKIIPDPVIPDLLFEAIQAIDPTPVQIIDPKSHNPDSRIDFSAETLLADHGEDGKHRYICRRWPRDPKGQRLLPSTRRGKETPNGIDLWGATLFDFFYICRFPEIPNYMTRTTGSKCAAAMREIGELEFAKDELAWADNEGDPKELYPFSMAELLRCSEMPLRRPSDSESMRKDDSSPYNDSSDPPQDSPALFDFSNYPPPFPYVPFAYKAPVLQHHIKVHHLPQKLLVHDPWNLLLVQRRKMQQSDRDADTPWSEMKDKVRTYNLHLFSNGNQSAENEIAKEKTQTAYEHLAIFHPLTLEPDFPIFIAHLPSPPPPPQKMPLAHLYLRPGSRLGTGNHSVVYKAEWEIPRAMAADDTHICHTCVNGEFRQAWIATGIDNAEESLKYHYHCVTREISTGASSSEGERRETGDHSKAENAENVEAPETEKVSPSTSDLPADVKEDAVIDDASPSSQSKPAKDKKLPASRDKVVASAEIPPVAAGASPSVEDKHVGVTSADKSVNEIKITPDHVIPGAVSPGEGIDAMVITPDTLEGQKEDTAKANFEMDATPDACQTSEGETVNGVDSGIGSSDNTTADARTHLCGKGQAIDGRTPTENQPACKTRGKPEGSKDPDEDYFPYIVPGLLHMNTDQPQKRRIIHFQSAASWKSSWYPSNTCAHRATTPSYELKPRTAKVTVAAKLSFRYDPHLSREARNYQDFPAHLSEHWSGYNLMPGMQDPVPVGAVVPKFYGYYTPNEAEIDSAQDTYLSPILLLEHCGSPIEPDKLSWDERNECRSLVFRFHHAGWIHNSIATRNILEQRGPLTAAPADRGKRSFRLIDFGRSVLGGGLERAMEECQITKVVKLPI